MIQNGKAIRTIVANRDKNSLYMGRVLEVTDTKIIQQVNEGTAIAHDRGDFNSVDVQRGDIVTIRYKDGWASTRKAKKREGGKNHE